MLACSIDGALCTESEAHIPVNDHGLLYGDGVFEGLRFYHGRVFRLDEHLDRLFDSATAINLVPAMTRKEMKCALNAAIEKAGTIDGYIRLVITRGSGPLGIDPSQCLQPRTIIIVDHLVMVAPEKLEHGVNTIISSVRRLGPDQLDPRIKSLNYMNQILARMEAKAAGADEAILLNSFGRVAEGSADNIFIVKDGRLLTPPLTEGALAGITRGAILDCAQSLGIPNAEVPLAPLDLYTADECFLSGTGAELIPVATISGRILGPPGTMFRTLSMAFRALIEREAHEVAQAV